MRVILLVLTFLGFSQLSPAVAETFSCRDSKGALYVADNLMSLPEGCRNQARTRAETDSGQVNYVPSATQPGRDKDAFERAVKEEIQASDELARKTANMVLRAETLVETYENALAERKNVIGRRRYGARETIVKADREMQFARKGKKELLNKLKRARIPSEQRQKIDNLLTRIPD